MPFLEHYLPFYDGLRGAPVFVEHAPNEQDSPMKRESGIFLLVVHPWPLRYWDGSHLQFSG